MRRHLEGVSLDWRGRWKRLEIECFENRQKWPV